jgi:DNA repair exonuclease SbcCD ATPase subunit
MARIEKIKEARIEVGDRIEAVLYNHDEYNDDSIEIDRFQDRVVEFPIGCFDLFICMNTDRDDINMYMEGTIRELEELRDNKQSIEEKIREKQDYIEHLKERKRELENAGLTRETTIEYSICKDYIEETTEELEELKDSKKNIEEEIREKEEYIERLKERKRNLENMDLIREMVIQYSMCKLTIKYENEKGEYVEMGIDNDKDLTFKNIKLNVWKY